MSTFQITALTLSLIGAAIAIFCYLPGAIKTLKYNDTRGISAVMFGMTCLGCVIWIIYAIVSICGCFLDSHQFIDGKPNMWAFVAGFATLISNIGLGSFGAVILVKKLSNLHKAKKEGLTEDQWYKKHYENKNK